MKNLFLNIAGILLLGAAITGCTSDEFSGGDPNGIAKINEADYTVTVDQATNIVTFRYNKSGEYPVWTVKSTPEVTSTLNGFQKKFIFKGTYNYTLRVGNRNGISDGEASGTFTIDNTRYDFSKTIAALTGDGTKEWRIYSATAGHLACGPEGTEGTEWYSANAQEKAGEGIYDDRITFSNTNDYTYSAGNDGLTFCNVNVTNLGVTGAGSDYSAPVIGKFGAQTTAKYQLGYNDDKQQETITLPGKTLFPYMGNNVQMEKDYTLRILKMEDKYMTLILDLPGIAWQLKFINGDDPAA